jgi:predicted phage tail component-like protein
VYTFRDTTDHTAITTALPAEACSINGQYLEDVVEGYRTLYTKGRESLGAELDTYETGTADGSVVKGRRYPPREIKVGFQLIAKDPIYFRFAFTQLNNLLSLDSADFIFADEPEVFFTGTPIFDAEVDEGQLSVKGEWTIYCAYPFKRSVAPKVLTMADAEVTDTSATFTIDYQGGQPARPILRATFASAKTDGESSEDGDCGFVAFLDEKGNIIQLGNPDALDLDEDTKASTFINRTFTSVSDWQTTGGHTWNNRPVTGTVSTGNLTDAYWQNGKGQTQSYAKPSYGSGSGWHGSILHKAVDRSANFTLDLVHRLCVSKASECGTFECGARDGSGDLLAGFVIDKSANGTTGSVYYVVNNTILARDSIDLSYYNTHFGYCNRTPVYVNQTYTVNYNPPILMSVRVVKKGRKYWTKRAIHKKQYVRTVQKGWNYTQSNLNSHIYKQGNYIKFKVGNLPMRTFYAPQLSVVPAESVSCYMGAYGNTAMNTNAIHSLLFRREAGVVFSEQPNVFTADDIVEADCNDASVNIYRQGSEFGLLEPQYGALGNDWESFTLEVGVNIIRATWSDWVNPDYKPQIEIEYNEVFI